MPAEQPEAMAHLAVRVVLRDLQDLLKLATMRETDKEAREEHEQILETRRRRVAALN